MNTDHKKFSLFHIIDTLLWLASLVGSISYYYTHKGSPTAFLGIGLMAGFFILSIIFKIIRFFLRFFLILFLMVLAYFIFIRHEEPKSLHVNSSMSRKLIVLETKKLA